MRQITGYKEKRSNTSYQDPKKKIQRTSFTLIKNPKFFNVTVFEKREREILEEEKQKKYQKTLPFLNTEYATSYKTLPSVTNANADEAKWFKKKLEQRNKNGLYLTEASLSSTAPITKDHTQPLIQKEEKDYGTNLLEVLSERQGDYIANIKKKEKEKMSVQSKIKTLNLRKDGARDFIFKTRDIIAMKYTLKMKEERSVRLKEIYQNELESIEDTIKSLKEAENLFISEFYSKFSEYIKFLLKQKDIEKKRLDELEEKKAIARKAKAKLEKKGTKQQGVISFIAKWIELMAMLYEKKENLPGLKYVLEMHEPKETDYENYLEKYKIQREEVSKEDFLKYLGYRNNLIYETPEDFEYAFSSFEKLTLDKMLILREEEKTKSKLVKRKKEILETLAKEQGDDEDNRTFFSNLIIKSSKLSLLQTLNKKLRKELQELEKTNTSEEMSECKKKRTKEKGKNKKEQKTVKDVIEAVNRLYQTVFTFNKHVVPNISIKNTILLKLSHIEISMDLLNLKLKKYKISHPDWEKDYNAIKAEIEKKHKEKNYLLQKMEQKMQREKLRQQIESNNKKVYYLAHRKPNAYLSYIKGEKRSYSQRDKKERELTFEDLMYDVWKNNDKDRDKESGLSFGQLFAYNKK
ncbi:MAG: hypothetical protein MJ252_07755 [archaeon]|nr:hypothetical protein [archaeon]